MCYEEHKPGFWVESSWQWRETTLVWMANGDLSEKLTSEMNFT